MDPSKTIPLTWQEALDAYLVSVPKKTRVYVPGVVVLKEPLFTDMDDKRFLDYRNGWVFAREQRGHVIKMWSLT